MAEATGDDDDEREMHVLAEFEPTLSGPDEVKSTIKQLIQQVVGDYHNVSLWHSNRNLCLRLASLFEEQGASLCRVQFSSIHFYVLTKTRANYKRFTRACTDGTLSMALTDLLVTPALEDAAGVQLRVRTHLQESSMLSDIPQTTDVEEKKVRSLHGMSSNDVADWLVHEVDIPGDVAARFQQEDVDGALLAEYKENHIKKDFNLTTGIWRKIKYAREKLLGVTSSDSSSSESGGEESNKPIKRLVEERASLAEGDFDHSSREALSSSSMSKGNEMGQLQRGQLRFDGETDANYPQRSALKQHTLSKEKLSAEEERVRYLLTGEESGTLDIAFHPLLVVNKPQTAKSEGCNSLRERFGFTSLVNWNAVFDCDSMSLKNGLCAMVQEEKDLKLLLPSTFRKELSLEEVEFNDVPAWIFTNGREDLDDIATPSLTSEWNEKYSADVDRAVDFFTTSAIPRDRAVIIFLLLSDTNIQIMSDIFKKLQSSMQGKGSFTFLVNDVKLYEQWAQEVKKWLPREQLNKRSYVVDDWRWIDGHIRKLIGKTSLAPALLPKSKKQACILPDKERSKWQNIEVLLLNECENPAMDENSPEFQDLAMSEEHNFYRGNAVSWWNFFLTDEKVRERGYNHVLQRDASKILQSKVETKLENMKNASGPLVTFTVFHQPGSGASTAARQVMWNYHRQIRCVTVRRAIQPTVKEIVEVRHFGYSAVEDIPPVLVLLDDMDDSDVIDFIAQLKAVYKNEDSLTCVILHCKRTPDPEAMANCNGANSVVLKHKLSNRERNWFEKKFNEYEEKYSEKPERLIGFMVMKEECNPDYIRRIVSRILEDISGTEAQLLKYISVISMFMENFGMPVSCCDEFMIAHTPLEGRGSRRLVKHVPWENLLSNAIRILLLCTKVHTKQGLTKVIKLVSPSLAEELVKQLVECENEKIGDVISEFIHESGILESKAYMNTYMVLKTRELLVRRKVSEFDSREQSQFSPLITYLLEEDKPEAFRLLDGALEKFQSGIIAQQLARLHLAEKNFDEAKYFANKAIGFQETNSFFLHTLGLIIIQEMATYQKNADTPLDEKETDILLGLLQEGITAFQKCQQYSKTEETHFSIFSGYTGELQVIFRFLRILEQRERSFCAGNGRDVIRRYLLTNEEIPTLNARWIACREQLQELAKRANISFESINDLLTCSKNGSVAKQDVGNELHVKNHKFPQLYDDLVWFFCMSNDDDPPTSVKNDQESMNNWRRTQVRSMKADTFNAIFKLAQNEDGGQLTTVLQLLNQNRPKNVFDLKLLVCVHFALASLGKKHTDFDTVSQMIADLNDFDRSLYGALFALLLAWPKDSGNTTQNTNGGISTEKAVINLREKWNKMISGQNSTKRNDGHDRSLPRHQLVKRRPLTHFLLAKGKGFERFVHIFMFRATNSTLEEERYKFWSRKEVVEKLVRLEGTIQDAERLVFRTPSNERIYIRISRPRPIQPSQEKVTFFLGFNFAGPLAYDVTEKRKELAPNQVRETPIREAYPGYLLGSLNNLYEKEDEIIAKLEDIDYKTRKRRNRQQLTAEERTLVQSRMNLEKDLEQIRNKIQQKTEQSSDDDDFVLVVRRRGKARATGAASYT
ncbi:sterile alpha motif domain-containing protein 9-like [Diadema setosum]|uniref:sterile alpha motif domain-containing protein 9-like n=1 Tax=Diadema setosum TaxID=31175 RepID=UPI003B3BAF6A